MWKDTTPKKKINVSDIGINKKGLLINKNTSNVLTDNYYITKLPNGLGKRVNIKDGILTDERNV